jgi:flagellar motility protein MotE (MotC chaperone)
VREELRRQADDVDDEQAAAHAATSFSPSSRSRASHAARAEKSLQDARRQMLSEKEAALAAKELELKKLSEKLDAQLKSIEDNKKRQEELKKIKEASDKKQQEDKLQKMVKLFKSMKGEQAGKLIDSLPENQALTVLSRMDTKTVAKLAVFLNQPRVVKWISENISTGGD